MVISRHYGLDDSWGLKGFTPHQSCSILSEAYIQNVGWPSQARLDKRACIFARVGTHGVSMMNVTCSYGLRNGVVLRSTLVRLVEAECQYHENYCAVPYLNVVSMITVLWQY